MNKQEQIEEMAKDIVRIAGLDVYGKAEELVNLGYRKLPDALDIITKQEKEIEQLTRELAKEQEACVECELEQSWELFWRDQEIDRLRAERKRDELLKEYEE